MAGFKGFEARFLPSFEDEELTFIAEFPEESGNEFQGLETQFAIIFFARSGSVKMTMKMNRKTKMVKTKMNKIRVMSNQKMVQIQMIVQKMNK